MKKKTIETAQGLLDHICDLAGYDKLSDLHDSSPWSRILIVKAARQAKAQNYSLKEWTDAVIYITGELREFRTAAEAADYLVKKLQS